LSFLGRLSAGAIDQVKQAIHQERVVRIWSILSETATQVASAIRKERSLSSVSFFQKPDLEVTRLRFKIVAFDALFGQLTLQDLPVDSLALSLFDEYLAHLLLGLVLPLDTAINLHKQLLLCELCRHQL
jgi:hypothetical protein